MLMLMVATGPSLAIVWDEGFTLGREQRIRLWLRALRDPQAFAAEWQPPAPWEELVQPDGRYPPQPAEIDTREELFDQRVIEWFWPFAREEPHGHPPFYALVGLIGDIVAPSWELLPRARLGPMLAFSLAAGAIFGFVARRRGYWPAALAAGAWGLQPRLFAHGHYAHYDALLTSLWVGSILAFTLAVETSPGEPRRRPRWGWVVLFGTLAGCTAGTKLTGWFLPLPFLAWTALCRDRRGWWTLLIGGIVAVLVLYALTPPWWNNPIAGVERFLRSNLTRSQTTRIPTLFLGRIILTPKDSLPWYNTLVWTVFVTPVGFLSFAVTGVVRAIRQGRSDPYGLLPVAHWAFLLILRALPHTPGHDAERQFLAAFGCLALVAGQGAVWAVERLGRWGKALIVAALTEGAVSIALMMPVPLSYYSPLVGGLPGATRLGMEPTYYWDALTDDALAWINQHTDPGRKVMFPTYPTTWLYLRRTGKLKVGALPYERGLWQWYVLQNRTGAFKPSDRALVARAKPENVLVSKWGVPLIYVFPSAEAEALQRSLDPPPGVVP
ncbi:MAG: glycosyltransferase family 39 protein [Isosphaeraceae bacterium]|nr:glycosyltransferase family 39 protein [Isosphaeraceae bacterium]